MGSLPWVTSRNGILNFTITDLHLLVAQCQIYCMAQCVACLRIILAASVTATTAPAACGDSTSSSATDSNRLRHHNVTVRAICSPVLGLGRGIINQQLACGICLFTSLLALFQLFSYMLHADLHSLRCIHSLCISHNVTCDVSHDTLVLFEPGA